VNLVVKNLNIGRYQDASGSAVGLSYFILNDAGTTSSTLFPVQCHLGTLSQTCSPLARILSRGKTFDS